MRFYLFAAVLGCIVLSGLAQREVFEFTDSHGRCWSCSPGAPCSPCQRNNIIDFQIPPPVINPVCEVDTIDCGIIENRSIFFPTIDPRTFLRCAPATATTWLPVVRDCQCGALFSYNNQRCDVVWQWEPFCQNVMNVPDPVSCADDLPISTPPTAPPEGPITIVPPTNAPPTNAPPTPAPPCGCIPWFPCWCNPCWSMPCGNCNGCQG